MTVRWLITWYNLDPETPFPPVLPLQTIIIGGRCHLQTFRTQQITFISGPSSIYRVRRSSTTRRHFKQEWLNSSLLNQEWLKQASTNYCNSTGHLRNTQRLEGNQTIGHRLTLFAVFNSTQVHSFSWSVKKSVPAFYGIRLFIKTYRNHKCPPLNSALRQLNPIQKFKFTFRTIHFNIILHLWLGLSP